MKYRHLRAVCQACRVDHEGNEFGFQPDQTTIASGAGNRAAARRSPKALLA